MAPSVDIHRLSLAILAAVLISVGPVGIVAQSSTAVCLSSFDWMSNSKGQNPCVVSAYLEGACYGGPYTIKPLPAAGYYYPGPYANDSNPCQCSSVTYNTMSACSLCQNGTAISWSVWDTNCTTVYPGVFPLDVPTGTAVPQWAFQDVTTSDLFSVTLAQSVGDSPESTALNNAKSTGSVYPTDASASLTASPSPTGTGTASSGSSSSTAAIVGGVVGGVVGLALIAGVVVFFVMKKKRSQTPPSALFTSPTSPAPPSGVYTDTTPFVPQMAQSRLYDPSDPSTFPASPPSTTIQTGSSHGIQHTVNYSTSSMQPGGYYAGVPII
ncbi:hypothetical protein HD554DRAFT_2168839 [Boletus coccyginus]|nr:hypothetical protein HD554DRAFT_2168839 [Boletus coccyginus]